MGWKIILRENDAAEEPGERECEQCGLITKDAAYWDCWCMNLCDPCLDALTEGYKAGYRDGERGLKR